MKIAVLFPGQGSQVVGMGQALAAAYPAARASRNWPALLPKALASRCSSSRIPPTPMP